MRYICIDAYLVSRFSMFSTNNNAPIRTGGVDVYCRSSSHSLGSLAFFLPILLGIGTGLAALILILVVLARLMLLLTLAARVLLLALAVRVWNVLRVLLIVIHE
jgi:hypothetical protein